MCFDIKPESRATQARFSPNIPDTSDGVDIAEVRLCAPTSFSMIGKAIILRAIEHCNDPADKKWRIMLAREHGHLTGEEATALIVKFGLEAL